jgi:hypothetical protein
VRSIAVLGLAAFALAAGAACGGGGHGTPRAAKRAIEPDAQRRAESINLKLSDFPSGWRASTRSPDDPGGSEKFRECMGMNVSDTTLIGDADSKEFAKEGGTIASSEARILKSAAQAQQGLDRISKSLADSARAEECLRGVFKKTPADYKVGEIDVGELSFHRPADVDEAKAWEMLVHLEATSGVMKGQSVPVYLDLTYLRKGDAVTNVQTLDTFSPFDSELRDNLVQAVARRMSAD